MSSIQSLRASTADQRKAPIFPLRLAGLGLLCCFVIFGFGQTVAPTAPIDTNIFEAFLRFQNFLAQTIQTENATNAASSAAMKTSAAALLKVGTVDFDKINPVYLSLKAKLDALDSEGVAYVESTAGKGLPADVNVLAGFEARRQALVEAAMADLKGQLSMPAGTGYIATSTVTFSRT